MICVCIIVAVLDLVFVVITNQVAFEGKNGKPHAGYDNADKAIAGEIDALGKAAAEHTKADAQCAGVISEECDK